MNDFKNALITALTTHFEKLLLAILFVFLLIIGLHYIHHGDKDSIIWLQNLTGQVLAALLALLVGNRIAQRNNDVEKKIQ